MKDWHDIPGYFSDADAELYRKWARDVPNGATIVELGTLMGRSAGCLLSELVAAGKHWTQVVCVDIWPQVDQDHKWTQAGWTESGDTLANCRRNLYDWRHRVQCIQGDVREASRLFLAGSVWAVFNDAGHNYECLTDCIGAWTPKVMDGGIMGGHDYNPTGWPDVVRAVNDTYGADGVATYGSCWEAKNREK